MKTNKVKVIKVILAGASLFKSLACISSMSIFGILALGSVNISDNSSIIKLLSVLIFFGFIDFIGTTLISWKIIDSYLLLKASEKKQNKKEKDLKAQELINNVNNQMEQMQREVNEKLKKGEYDGC